VLWQVNGTEEEESASHLRPQPPEVGPAEWKALVGANSPLELFFKQGWWNVVVTEVKKTCFAVVALDYAKHHTVGASKLRPRWSYDPAKCHEPSGGWSLSIGGTTYALTEWREQVSATASAQPSSSSSSSRSRSSVEGRFWHQQPALPGPQLCGSNGCTLPDRHSGLCMISCEGSRKRKAPERLEQHGAWASANSSHISSHWGRSEALSRASSGTRPSVIEAGDSFATATNRLLDEGGERDEGERCEVCGLAAWNEPGRNDKGEWIDGNWMLLCDGCGAGRHTLCCSPPLLSVRLDPCHVYS